MKRLGALAQALSADVIVDFDWQIREHLSGRWMRPRLVQHYARSAAGLEQERDALQFRRGQIITEQREHPIVTSDLPLRGQRHKRTQYMLRTL